MASTAAPRGLQSGLLVLCALLLGSALVLDWNLEVLAGGDEFLAGLRRLGRYLATFTSPDLSATTLDATLWQAVETVATALLGVAFGLALAAPLALLASRAVVAGGEPALGPRRLVVEGSRLLLDVLRGVPDFAWAIVLANFTGTNSVTGVLAIGVSVAGILGKVLSEQFDNLEPQRYAALRSTGAGTLQVFFYGMQPLASRAMLSFVLMRTECAIRNASVIGVVGGGGLGAGLWDHYADGNWARVSTTLLCMLAVTATADLAANLLRYQLRIDPNHPRAHRSTGVAVGTRRRVLGALVVLLLLALAYAALHPVFVRVVGELAVLEGDFVWDYTRSLLFTPDLSADALGTAARASLVPLAIGLLGTVAAVGLAATLAFPASVAFQLDAARFTGEHPSGLQRARRLGLVGAARALALVLRGVPEVAWVLVLAVFFKSGLTPCVLAVVLHSTGVLHRVFTETLDNVPYRRLEQVSGACRPHVFLYGALPEAMPDWRTYAFFQFEVNVRIGIVLGMVGAGGLGDLFDTNLKFRENHRAGTYLWAMVVLTIAIDRLSRWLQLRRAKC
ncbi:MAG: PhnE/PtxC family ABC transporter permease [Planctomycetota bacterium]